MLEKTLSLTCHPSVRPSLLFEGYGFDDSAERFSLVRCEECQIVSTFPCPSSEVLSSYYSKSYYGESDQKFKGPLETLVRKFNDARVRKLLAFLPDQKNLKILDVGCGRGNFVASLSRQGIHSVGTEISDIPRLLKEVQGPGKIEFLKGALETLHLEPHSFDAVSIWHVLEHTLNPHTTLEKINHALKPKGVLAIAVPNFGSFQSRLFGKHWFHLDLPRHLFHLTRSSLERALKTQGFEPMLWETRSADQNLYGFVQSALNSLFSWQSPNLLYGTLKNSKEAKRSPGQWLSLFVQLGLCTLLGPLALIENWISTGLGRGATLIVYAKKKS